MDDVEIPVRPISIRRYGSARLYAPDPARYVSLDELRALAAAGRIITVIDVESGLDVTRLLLAEPPSSG